MSLWPFLCILAFIMLVIRVFVRRRPLHMAPLSQKLTPAEHLMVRLHEDEPGSMVVVADALVADCLTRTEAIDAGRELQRRHLCLQSVIDGIPHGFAWRVSDQLLPMQVTWEEVDTFTSWPDRALSLAAQPFDRTRDCLLRIHVMQHRTERFCHVILAGHHAAVDGRSMATLLSEFLYAVRGASVLTTTANMRPLPHVSRSNGIWWPLAKEIVRQIPVRGELQWHPPVATPSVAVDRNTLCRRTWTADGTAALITECDWYDTTVMGAASAALIGVLWRDAERRGCSVHFRIPFDIRQHCEPPLEVGEVGCYATMLDITLVNPSSTTFWELARRVRQEIKGQLASGLWRSRWYLLQLILSRGVSLKVPATLFGVSNLGRLSFPELNAGTLREFSTTVTQRGTGNNLRLTLATVDGVLNLTVRTPWHTPQEANQLLADIIDILAANAGVASLSSSEFPIFTATENAPDNC